MRHPGVRKRHRLRYPSKLGQLIHAHSRRWRLLKIQRLEVIRLKWVEAAGEYIARHVVPARLVRKTLRVVAEDSNWASEMTYLIGPILERLQKLLPGDWVEEIRVVQGEPLPSLDALQLSRSAPLMPATEEMHKLADESLSLAQVSDPQLAQAIRRALLAKWRRLQQNKKRS